MRTFLLATVAAMGMTGIAIAGEAKGPTVMTDAQMEQIVAGSEGWIYPEAATVNSDVISAVFFWYWDSTGNYIIYTSNQNHHNIAFAHPPSANDGQGPINACGKGLTGSGCL